MHQASKFSPVLFASVIMCIISVVPFLNFINLACCAGIMLGGASGAIYYNTQLKHTGQKITMKDGVSIGILSGLLSAIIVVIFTTLLSMFVNQNPIPEIYKIFEQYGWNIQPDAERFLQKISDEYNHTGFSLTITLITLVIDLISYPLFGALGGMLTVTILGKMKTDTLA